MNFSLGADLFPMLAGTLAAITCAVLGNFLVLRRQSLMGDAISHAVLPGLVVAFMLTSGRNPGAMLIGAAIAGVVTVVLVELVKKLGRVEPGAAMGVVFSVLFALGVLLIEQNARHIDLDADCVLHGQLETEFALFSSPASLSELFTVSTLQEIPVKFWTLAGTCVASLALVIVLFKELRLAAFDPALATTLGFNSTALHYVLMVFVAIATVVSFEAVGSILVIAMLVCPAATARLLTDRLRSQIVVSIGAAIASGVLGYIGASAVPALFGKDAVNAAGSITVAAGMLLIGAIIASPSHGVVVRVMRRRALARSIALQDLLAYLYRAGEQGSPTVAIADDGTLPHHARRPSALETARRRGLVLLDADTMILTPEGRARARSLVRRHRLWETYLVDRAGVPTDHVHDTAERLEHLPIVPDGDTPTDPHGKHIPPGEEPADERP